jgi:SAM-dependent methyltransferase
MDVFGRGFMAYMLGDDRNFRIVRDDGLEEEMEVAPYFTGFEKVQHEREAMGYVKGRVLDLGCGAGRVALWLQLRGFDVTGIDASPTAIEVCQGRGLKKCFVTSVEKLNFTPASFDTILMMGNNLGLAGTLPGTIEFLRKLHVLTTREGRIIGSGRDPSKTDNPAHLAYHERNRRAGKPIGQVRLQVRFGEEVTDWFSLLMVSIPDVEEIAKNAGWKIERSFEEENATYTVVLAKVS